MGPAKLRKGANGLHAIHGGSYGEKSPNGKADAVFLDRHQRQKSGAFASELDASSAQEDHRARSERADALRQLFDCQINQNYEGSPILIVPVASRSKHGREEELDIGLILDG